MKIRIVKAELPSYWYAGKIGEVFEVTSKWSGACTVKYGDGDFDSRYDVFNGDFEVISEEADEMDSEYIKGQKAGIQRSLRALGYLEMVKSSLMPKGFKSEVDSLRHIDEIVAALREGITHHERNINYIPPTKDNYPQASPQERRDEIVERAKADVAHLTKTNARSVSGTTGMTYHEIFVVNAEFIVNARKRTVACLLKGVHGNTVFSRGIAKADPSDCFNAHIGRAISLRRALGLEVPDEYLNAPQPTEVRVGDEVGMYVNGEGREYKFTVKTTPVQELVAKDFGKGFGSIINDSREG